MALTAADIKYLFKVFGKAIHLGRMGEQTSLDYRTMTAVTNRQISPSGIVSEYDEIKYVGVPLQQSVENVVEVGTSLAPFVKASLSTYFQQSLAPEVGLAVGANPSGVVGALAQAMDDTGQSVSPADGGYLEYFQKNFNTLLPTHVSPTIPDSWISGTFIP